MMDWTEQNRTELTRRSSYVEFAAYCLNFVDIHQAEENTGIVRGGGQRGRRHVSRAPNCRLVDRLQFSSVRCEPSNRRPAGAGHPRLTLQRRPAALLLARFARRKFYTTNIGSRPSQVTIIFGNAARDRQTHRTHRRP